MDRSFRWAPPVLSPLSVRRHRVLDQLAARWTVPVVTIVAGAGFGKTTLLAQLTQANALEPNGRDVWLSLQPSDSEASSLLEAIGTAIDPERPQAHALTVTDIAELIWTASPAHVALLLDDTHLIESGSAGEHALAELIERLPANGHVIASGRRQLDLKLTRLRSQDRLLELNEPDLAFDDEESRTLANRHGTAVQTHDFGGWPAMLELAHRHGVDKASEFALEEVIDRLDPDDKTLLLTASILDGASADQIIAVVNEAYGNTATTTRDLSQMPLVAVDADGSIRPHHLWLDLFTAAVGSDDLDQLRRAGAQVLIQEGDPGRAWELLARAGDFEVGLPALYDAVNHQARPPHVGQLERWRSLLPDELRSTPEAIYLDGIILRETEPWGTEVDQKMDAAVAAFTDAGDIGRALASSIRATFTSWLTCNTDKLRERGRLAETYSDAVPAMANVVTLNAVTRSDTEGDPTTSLEQASSISSTDFEPRLGFYVPMCAFAACLNTGRVAESISEADEVSRLGSECDGAGGTLIAAFAPTLARFLSGSLKQPPESLARADRYNIGEQIEVRAWLGLIAAHSGDLSLARELLADLSSATRPSTGHPRFCSIRSLLGATVAMEDGNEERARTIITELVNGTDTRIGASWRALAWMPGIPTLLVPELAAQLLERSPGLADVRGFKLSSAILSARRGERWSPEDVPIDEPEAVFASLTLTPAIELACDAHAGNDERGQALITEAVRRWPARTRDILRALTDHSVGAVATQASSLLRVVPIPPAEAITITVLGNLTLRHGHTECTAKDWRRDRVRQLLLHLVHRRRMRRDRLAAVLWPDLDDDRASSNLRLTLHYLQGVLEPDRASGDAPYFLHQSEGVLELAGVDRLAVDAWTFDDLTVQADNELRSGQAASAMATLSKIVDLWQGEYLADLDEGADVVLDRADYKRRFVRHGVRLGELQLGSGDQKGAVETARAVLDAEPWSEAAYRVLIEAWLSTGDRPAALHALESCIAMLDELDVEPAKETIALRRRISGSA